MDSLIGKTIDNYRILEVIGRGGMGVVFKALDDYLEKIVALKMIDPFLAKDENFTRRFKTEAKALAKLENPNIVGVHALRNTEAGLFMVMEYVDAKPLSYHLRENGPFNIKDTISILKQLLNAIGHAHQVGVIHRDIKPSNILLCDNGKIKVTDFGLAKVVQQRDGASTVTQARAGTLYYMSPEQIKGLKNVDTRSDLYSLGMTVYEMLTGRVPFDKTDSDFTIQRQIVDGEIPSPIKFNAGINKKFIRIILKSIAKEPEKRYQTADEMLEDIIRFEKEISTEKKAAKLKEKNKDKSEIKSIINSNYKKPISIVGSFVILLAAGFIYFLLSSDGEKNSSALFSISTTPDSAEIFINSALIGKSPVAELEMPSDESINVMVKKEGFLTLDTLLKFQNDEHKKLNIRLAELVKEENVIKISDRSVLPANKSGTLNVSTNPNNAVVYLDGKEIGSTPIESSKVEEGTHKLLIRKKGYQDYNQSIKIITEKPLTISKDLISAVKLTVKSEPTEAEVIINDKSAGKTPFINNQAATGNYKITIKKPGFKTYSENVLINDNKSDREISVKLEELNAKVEILVRPFGSIYVDEELKVRDTNAPYSVYLTGGTHQLKIIHPTFGSLLRSISIIDEKPLRYNFDLSRVMKLTVISSPPNSEIFINDQSTQKYTPALLTFTPGSYKVQVKKEGYTASPIEKVYSIGSDIYEETKDREERIEFRLEKNE